MHTYRQTFIHPHIQHIHTHIYIQAKKQPHTQRDIHTLTQRDRQPVIERDKTKRLNDWQTNKITKNIQLRHYRQHN